MIDLHTHSTASDGSIPPNELICLAEAAGVTVIALTDHNTTSGLDEFLASAENSRVRAVAGAEITSEHNGKELHILALDLPRESYGALEEIVAEARLRSDMSKQALVESLIKAGYKISYDAICEKFPDRVINRSHIATALVEAGYVETVSEAFEKLLSEEAGYYRPCRRLDAREVIREIVKMGAIPVWAHPFLRFDKDEVDSVLYDLVPAGLAAMEVYYPTYTEEETGAAFDLIRKHGILPSGGSDFHGSIKPGTMLGIGRGSLCIPEEVAERLLL